MIKRRLDGHTGLLLQPAHCSESVVTRLCQTPHQPVGTNNVYARFQRRTPKIMRIESSVIAAHAFANNSPCRTKNVSSGSVGTLISPASTPSVNVLPVSSRSI